jgi:RNA polymerase sigma-B factor
MNPPERPPRSTREEFVEFALTRDERLQLARRFVSRGETYDDLVQVASLALVKSVDRFDPERGVEFSSFATRTVVGELKRHFRDRGWAIRAPRRIQELYLEIGPAIESLSHDLGRPPTITEMADSIGVAEEAVLEALEAGKSYHLTSIDAQDRKEGTILDRLGDVDAGFDGAEDRLALAISLADLSERQRTILNLRFVDGLTQTEIADRVGVSQMHVSRLLADSLAALRRAFE